MSVLLDDMMMERLLWELADRFSDDERHTLIVVGCGALALCYQMDFVTEDIDAFEWCGCMPDDVKDVVADVASGYGVSVEWLNDCVSQCIEPGDVATIDLMFDNVDYSLRREYENVNGVTTLTVVPISLEMLLLCKLEAARDKDVQHLISICDALGISTYDDIIDAVKSIRPDIEATYHWNRISMMAKDIIEMISN